MTKPKYIKWFEDVSKSDIPVAGGKGANLGEMTQAGIPVPPGFVVVSQAYFTFLEVNKLRPAIHKILSSTDISDSDKLNHAADKIKHLMAKSDIPREIVNEIFTSYHELTAHHSPLSSGVPVAVRSSATAEDLPEASFAGQQESYLNVIGDANVLQKVKECWMSLFGARSIFYRQQQKFDHFKVGIAVPIQQMIQSDVSGVMFTTDPISKDRDRIVIEAIFGLGDYIVQGVVTPDHYEVSRASGKIITKNIKPQEIMEVKSKQGVKQVKVPSRDQRSQKLTDGQISKLAEIGKKIHQHYFFPQDVEWAMEGSSLYIIQTRPITTLDNKSAADSSSPALKLSSSSILKGAPASPGIVSGPVRLIPDIKKLSRVKTGGIMVTDMTTPDFVPAMKRAAGIITNRGGLTSHAAIVSRELGVPCVVGTTTATSVLKDGMIVTVSGATGEIYLGAVTPVTTQTQSSIPTLNLPENFKTATRVYVNLAEPEAAERIAQKNVDGVGLLRAEFMIAGLGVHPKKVIAEKKQKEYIAKLAQDMSMFCKAFFPRPVVYRATDFKTNEYRSLRGGDKYEPVESNPMLGFRGAFRYIKNPDVFNLELEAIKIVRQKKDLNNLHLMIPYVSTVSELVEVKKLVAASGLYRSGTFKLWMMVEIPANVILLDDFLDVGIDGVSIGSNDLTMLTLGLDRDNQEVASQFDERNPAVLWALERTVKTCLKHGVTSSICGQAASEYPELVEKLVNWGITSVSVNPDAIERTREVVYYCESKLISRL